MASGLCCNWLHGAMLVSLHTDCTAQPTLATFVLLSVKVLLFRVADAEPAAFQLQQCCVAMSNNAALIFNFVVLRQQRCSALSLR